MNLRPYRYSRGVTLIELMIVVVIVSILAAVALPSYTAYVLRSHRVEAKTALLDLAGREERYYSTSQTGAFYTNLNTALGYPISDDGRQRLLHGVSLSDRRSGSGRLRRYAHRTDRACLRDRRDGGRQPGQ